MFASSVAALAAITPALAGQPNRYRQLCSDSSAEGRPAAAALCDSNSPNGADSKPSRTSAASRCDRAASSAPIGIELTPKVKCPHVMAAELSTLSPHWSSALACASAAACSAAPQAAPHCP